MTPVRFNGMNLEVSKEVEKPFPNYERVTYTISGEDAPRLHDILKQLKVGVSEIDDGRFTVTKAELTDPFMDMPYTKELQFSLASATFAAPTSDVEGSKGSSSIGR